MTCLYVAVLALVPFSSSAEPSAAQAVPGFSQATTASLELTDEEEVWLAAHPVIRVAATQEWPPFEFVDADGNYKGISADIFMLLSERIGMKTELVIGEWPTILSLFTAGEIDLCPSMGITPEREKTVLFTKPLLDFPHALYVRETEEDISCLKDLADRTVSVEKDYYTLEILQSSVPGIRPVIVENTVQALLKVANGEADAYLGNTAVSSYVIDRNVITGLKPIWCAEVDSLRLATAVHEDFAPLVGMLNRAIDGLSVAEKREIIERYTIVPQWVELTEAETAWIRDHPIIRLGVDPEFAPFEFVADDGSHQGMASDYVRLLNQRLGLNMQVVCKGLWPETVEMAKAHDIDVLPCVGHTREREKYFEFSDPYLTFYRVAVTREDGPLVSGLRDLEELRVAVEANTSHHGFLVEDSDISPMLCGSAQATLAAVARGEADAAIGNVATVSYWIRKLGLTNLKVAAPVDAGANHLYYAVRSDWPELVSILNKGLASVTEEEAHAIRKKWVAVAMTPEMDLGRILRPVAAVVAIASVFLGLLALHNRRLRKEIDVRKLAEEALQRSEQDYRTLVQSANSVILRMTPEGTIVFVNAFAERFFGYSANELIGQNIVGTIVPESEQSGRNLRALMHELTQNPDQFEANENENITKSGDRVWLAWSNRPLYDDHGRLKEILCVGADTTGRKRAEQVLYRYEFIVNTVDDMMSVLDVEGRYQAVNTAWCSAMGVEREAVIGRPLSEVWPSEVVEERVWPDLRDCLAGNLVEHESVVALPNQGERHCEVTMYPYADSSGVVTHAVVVTHDVTDWREAQAALSAAKQSAEAANVAKSAFLANMSHEIRTPMNAILGYAQLLLRQAGLSPDQRHALDAIHRSGDHLLALINDVLEMSKIEAGRIQLHPATFNLRNLLSDMQVMFQIRTNAKGVELATEVDESVPGFILADENRVRQVLINLLGNAVKFTDEGRVSVRVRRDGAAGEACCRLVFEVEDTGCGIPPEDHESIFDSFEQAGQAALRRGGTGLGLSISRSFARMMGGDIEVSSEPEAGSCFRFTMMAELGDAEEAEEPEPERRVKCVRSGQGELRVLVVDDRPTNRDLLCRLLEGAGFVTREAENGAEGLDIFIEWKPQVALVDLVMPVMNGREAIRRMRLEPHGRHAAIIAVTASTLDDERAEILAQGADAFLRKPFHDSELFELIRLHGKVDFEYEIEDTATAQGQPSPSLEAAGRALAEFPAEVRHRLRRAMVMGSIDDACSVAEEVRERAPGLADVISKCAEDFALHDLAPLLNALGD